MRNEPRNIFQKKCFRLFFLYDFCNVKEKRSLRFMFETFSFSYRAERLTRETSGQNIKIRNLCRIYFCDIPKWILGIICRICFLSRFVPFACKDTLTAIPLHSKTKTANSSKQIDECKRRISHRIVMGKFSLITNLAWKIR